MPPTVLGFDVSSEDGWSGSELFSLIEPVCQRLYCCFHDGDQCNQLSVSDTPGVVQDARC